MTKPAIVLFDETLRLRDHPSLYEAAQSNRPLILLYIYDSKPKGRRPLGASQRWWLHHSLASLSERVELTLREGHPPSVLEAVTKESGADAVYWNATFDPEKRKERLAMRHALEKKKVNIEECLGNLLIDPREIVPMKAPHFSRFAPFWRSVLDRLDLPKPLPIPTWKDAKPLHSDQLSSWQLLDGTLSERLKKVWQPGEEAAHRQLTSFIQNGLKGYHLNRDRIDLPTTSNLSPYILFGEISIREVWHQVKEAAKVETQSKDAFLREVGFREFSYYILHHFPQLRSRNFDAAFDRFPWKKNAAFLKAWKAGKTGYPIVDAGMRQLKECGWIHNRVRMVVASFLTKDLLIDWREGEKWFWEHLVDGDPASNPFNWQWVAGCGVDAAPYFRIFNPTLQAEKFDPNGDYVRQWLPELGSSAYPRPIVDHKEARKEALALKKREFDS